jgi:hypothetical protein
MTYAFADEQRSRVRVAVIIALAIQTALYTEFYQRYAMFFACLYGNLAFVPAKTILTNELYQITYFYPV